MLKKHTHTHTHTHTQVYIDLFHILVHSPNGNHDYELDQTEARILNSMQVSHMGTWGSNTGAMFWCCSQGNSLLIVHGFLSLVTCPQHLAWTIPLFLKLSLYSALICPNQGSPPDGLRGLLLPLRASSQSYLLVLLGNLIHFSSEQH